MGVFSYVFGRLMGNSRLCIAILVFLIGVCISFCSYHLGYSSATLDVQKSITEEVTKKTQEQLKAKDEAIDLLITERNSLRDSLSSTIGKLQYATRHSNRDKQSGTTKDPARISLERCRQFNLEGAELLREATEGYRRESLRVDAINKIVKEGNKDD